MDSPQLLTNIAIGASLVQSIVGLSFSMAHILYANCYFSPRCPDDGFDDYFFYIYARYVDRGCHLFNSIVYTPTGPYKYVGLTDSDAFFVYQIIYSTLYWFWIASSIALLLNRRFKLANLPWCIITLAILVCDLLLTSFILTDFFYEQPEYACFESPEDFPSYVGGIQPLILMLLYCMRLGIIWIFNLVLLIFFVYIIFIKPNHVKGVVHPRPLPMQNLWINAGFQQDSFRQPTQTTSFGSPETVPDIRLTSQLPQTQTQISPFYGASEDDFNRTEPQQPPQDNYAYPRPTQRVDDIRKPSFRNRIQEARENQEQVVPDGGMWRYTPNTPHLTQRSQNQSQLEPDRDVDQAFHFLNNYEDRQSEEMSRSSMVNQRIPRRKMMETIQSSDNEDDFSIPRVKPVLGVNRQASVLSNPQSMDIGDSDTKKRYYVPLKQ